MRTDRFLISSSKIKARELKIISIKLKKQQIILVSCILKLNQSINLEIFYSPFLRELPPILSNARASRS